jgi:hypothetical protein
MDAVLLAPSPTPPRSDSIQPSHARPGHRHGHRGHPIEAEHHRPPPDPSPCHQHHLDPADQFPEPATLERDRAWRPVHIDVSRSGRPARPERASCSRAPQPRLTPLFTLPCMARRRRRHATPALPPGRSYRPRQARF